jgi:predicted lipoprotein with Yx(FWY)xxD motif
VTPKNKKQTEEQCLGECQEYFVPYLVEEDSTRQTRIGDFTVQQYQVNQKQWHYKNQPVFILVNSYGWPFLDKLEEFNMRLISP